MSEQPSVEAQLDVIRAAFKQLGWNMTPVHSLTAALERAERELAERDETHQGWINRTNAAERDREHIFKDLENVGAKLERAERERDYAQDSCVEWKALCEKLDRDGKATSIRQEDAELRAEAAEARVAELEAACDSTMHQENYDAACLRADEAEARAQKAEAVVEAARGVMTPLAIDAPASDAFDRLAAALTAYDEPPTEQA